MRSTLAIVPCSRCRQTDGKSPLSFAAGRVVDQVCPSLSTLHVLSYVRIPRREAGGVH